MLLKHLSFLASAKLALAAPHDERRDLPPAGTPTVWHTATAPADIAAAAATALTESSTSDIQGRAFDRILHIFLETTAYENAIADPDCRALIDQGILLSRNYGVGAPSQPNYIAPASGDTFGLNSDSFILVDRNISTIIDLLEDRGISWSNYNEGLPYSGFQGFRYENPTEGNYERKHGLLARFESIRLDPHRASRVKNLTLFYEDLRNQALPQWAFLTPNLYNDGHDTNISVSCSWVRGFVQPLLEDTYFNDNALIYITWQANGQNPAATNHVAGIILGDAVPPEYIGTVDDSYYNHYSQLSTVEANWDLHHLGRWDVGANVWKVVGDQTGDKIRYWNERIAGDSFESYYWNQSYGGVFSSDANTTHTYVAPNVDLERNGRTILPKIKELWGRSPAEWDWGWHFHDDRWPDNDGRPPAVGHEFKRVGPGGEHDWDDKGWDDRDWDGDDWEIGSWDDGDWGDDTWDDYRHHHNHHRHRRGRLPDYYRDIIELPDSLHPPRGFEVEIPLPPSMPITTPITACPCATTPTPPPDMDWMNGLGK